MIYFNVFDVKEKHSLGDGFDLKNLLIDIRDRAPSYNAITLYHWIDQAYELWTEIMGDKYTPLHSVERPIDTSFGETILRFTPYEIEGNVDQVYELAKGIYHIIPINEREFYPLVEFAGGIHADDVIAWAKAWNDDHFNEHVSPKGLAYIIKQLKDKRTQEPEASNYSVNAKIGTISVVIDLVPTLVPKP